MRESIGMHRSQKLNICIQGKTDVSGKDLSLKIIIENISNGYKFFINRQRQISNVYQNKIGLDLSNFI
jgi:hypothetical protein